MCLNHKVSFDWMVLTSKIASAPCMRACAYACAHTHAHTHSFLCMSSCPLPVLIAFVSIGIRSGAMNKESLIVGYSFAVMKFISILVYVLPKRAHEIYFSNLQFITLIHLHGILLMLTLFSF